MKRSKGPRQAATTARHDDEIGEETKLQKIRCLDRRNVDDQDIDEDKLVENHPTFVVSCKPTPDRDTARTDDTPTRQHEVLHRRRRSVNHKELCSGLVDTRIEGHPEDDTDRRPSSMCFSGI